ncbi:hypothetical protein NOCA2300044 [metagenome]|uniref:Uncharacterized protein n=1 Tax=metagenome TaxID=256318 RepID=A0A2P2C502_9ZZZZ
MKLSVASATVVRLQLQRRHVTSPRARVEIDVPGAPAHAVSRGSDRTLCGEALADLHAFPERPYGDVLPENRCPDCHQAFLNGWLGRRHLPTTP